MTHGGTDHDVQNIQSQLDGLAEALLTLVNDQKLDTYRRDKFRKLACAAVTRSTKLPALALDDRTAWLHRTKMFVGALSKVLMDYLEIQLE